MIGVNARSDADYYLKGACAETAAAGRARGAAEYELRGVDHGEPAGVWMTRGANPLGVSGEVDPEEFRTLVNDLRDPTTGEALGKRPYRYASSAERLDKVAERYPDATPEELAKLRTEAQRGSRQAVHGFDVTFSLPKSWSVLHAALEREGRQDEADAVWDAAVVGINAALDVAARDLAYTRDQKAAGPEVAGRSTTRYVHNGDWTMAMFRHHTSRDADPQLHAHVMLLNRVRDPETGRWKTIHSAALLKNKHMLDAVFLRVAEARLTETTGFTFAARPDNKAREVRGVGADVRDFFSTRSRAVSKGAEKLIAEYTERYGRAPSKFLRYQINQHVTLATRAAKPDETPARADELARWDRELGGRVAGAFAQVLAQADAARADRADEVGGFDPHQVIEQAIADLDATKSTFTRANLYHAIANRLPDDLGGLGSEQVVGVLDELTDAATEGRSVVSLLPPAMVEVPEELRDRRGRSVFDAPGVDRFTTRANLAREDSLVARLDQVGGRTVDEATARAALADKGLGEDQHRIALDFLTSARRVHLVVGPAGAGKSRLMAAVDAAQAELHGAGLVGLSTSQNAAQVLQDEGVGRAFNIARFLDFHRREAEGRVTRREREQFALPAGATVVFDEAGTISTRDFYDVMAVLNRAGVGKVLMVGDTEQVDAVDNAGAFAMLCDHAEPHRLSEVRRFLNDWERDASAALRTGDAHAVHSYDVRGRVHGGSAEEMRREATESFLADYLSGRDSVIVTSSGVEADRIASYVQARLGESGRVGEETVPLARAMRAGVADRVATRRNDWSMNVFNRQVWDVAEVHEDGSIIVSDGRTERHLPADYVRAHVDLAYAGTVEAVQGRTTDTAHLLVDQTMGRSRAYPGLTRGREANHAWVVTDGEQTAVGRLVDVVETDDHAKAARTVIAEEQDRAENLGHLGPQWQHLITEDRAAEHRAAIVDLLPPDDARRVLADRASAGLYRLLHRAEIDGRDVRADLTAAMQAGGLDSARSAAQALHGRLTKLGVGERAGDRGRVTTYVERVPAGDDPKRTYARQIAEQMDARVEALGEQVAQDRPGWADRLGELPDDPADRAAWVARAGHVAAFREQYGHTDEADVIGTQPPKAEPERRWVWSRAADALGIDPAQRDLEAQTDGALLNRVQAWDREQQWMPPNVDDRLRAAHQAADEARRQAVERAEDERAQARLARAQERTETLEAVAAARAAAVEATREVREQARVAKAELDRRTPADERQPEPAAHEPQVERTESERDAADLSRAQAAMAELARRAAERKDAERAPAEDIRAADRGVEVGE